MNVCSCIELLESVERTLGDKGFKELSDQLEKVGDDVCGVVEEGNFPYLPTVQGAHAAGMYLRQLQHDFPHNAMSGWALLRQLEAVYAFLACKVSSPLDGVRVDFSSDLEVKHVAAEFEDYPIARKN